MQTSDAQGVVSGTERMFTLYVRIAKGTTSRLLQLSAMEALESHIAWHDRRCFSSSSVGRSLDGALAQRFLPGSRSSPGLFLAEPGRRITRCSSSIDGVLRAKSDRIGNLGKAAICCNNPLPRSSSIQSAYPACVDERSCWHGRDLSSFDEDKDINQCSKIIMQSL